MSAFVLSSAETRVDKSLFLLYFHFGKGRDQKEKPMNKETNRLTNNFT